LYLNDHSNELICVHIAHRESYKRLIDWPGRSDAIKTHRYLIFYSGTLQWVMYIVYGLDKLLQSSVFNALLKELKNEKG
jgi:hypothetical protein